jgi:putative peptidoglycan lipid II flippase
MNDKEQQANLWHQPSPFDDGNSNLIQSLEFQYPHPSQSFSVEEVRQERERLRHQREQLLHRKGIWRASTIKFTQDTNIHNQDQADQQAGARTKGASVSRAALLLTTSSFLSRLLGLLRTSLFAHFGTNNFTDAYNLAFTLPNLVFNIIAGGALLSAFIPIFNLYILGKKDEKTAWHIASSALNISTALLMMIALVGMLFTPQIIHIAYFNQSLAQQDIIASLMRIMFLQSVILGAGVIVSSVLNARHNFFLPALGSILYPIGMLIGLIPSFVHPHHTADWSTVYYASWGVVLGAALMVGVQIPGLWQVGMHYHITFDWRHTGVRQIARQMVPRMVNSAMITLSQYIDILIIGSLAAYVGSSGGLQTQYNIALTIVTIPLGVITPLATASFPRMAEYVAKGQMDHLRTLILESLQSVLFIAIPAGVGLIILSLPVVQVLFERGSFTLSNAQSTAIPLICYALGLPALALVEILTRPFYAMRQNKVPVYISLMQLTAKIGLSLILLDPAVWCVQIGLGKLTPTTLSPLLLAGAWGMGALALATTLTSILEALALLWLLHRQLDGLHLRALIAFTMRVFVAVAVLSAIVLISHEILDTVIQTPNVKGDATMDTITIMLVALKLAISIILGTVVYLRTARFLHLLGGNTLRPVNRLLTRMHLAWI